MLRYEKINAGNAHHIQDKIEQYIGKHTTVYELCDGYSFVVFRGDIVVAAGGLVLRWEGVYTAWALIIEGLTLKEWVEASSFVAFVLDGAMKEKAVRIECSVLSNFERGHSWARRLGFSPEGVMRKYDSFGNDHVLYARVR